MVRSNGAPVSSRIEWLITRSRWVHIELYGRLCVPIYLCVYFSWRKKDPSIRQRWLYCTPGPRRVRRRYEEGVLRGWGLAERFSILLSHQQDKLLVISAKERPYNIACANWLKVIIVWAFIVSARARWSSNGLGCWTCICRCPTLHPDCVGIFISDRPGYNYLYILVDMLCSGVSWFLYHNLLINESLPSSNRFCDIWEMGSTLNMVRGILNRCAPRFQCAIQLIDHVIGYWAMCEVITYPYLNCILEMRTLINKRVTTLWHFHHFLLDS